MEYHPANLHAYLQILLCTHTHSSGVGDLYTDPQIHTASSKEYGEANLGAKGMALFFSSHMCSPLCQYLGLTQFDLSEGELERLRSSKWSQVQTSQTVVASSVSQTSGGKQKDEAELGVGMQKDEAELGVGMQKDKAKLGVETVDQAFRRLSMTWNLSQLAEEPAAPCVPETPLTPRTCEGFGNEDDSRNDDRRGSEPVLIQCDGVVQRKASTTQALSGLAEAEREGHRVLGQVSGD